MKINGKSIIIGNRDYPNIIKANSISFCNYERDLIDTKIIKLFFINKNFELIKAKFYNRDTFNFSTYLILNNNIIEEQKNEYKYSAPNNYTKVYGFSKEKFDLYQFDALEIALSFKINNFASYRTLFDMKQRKSFKIRLENFKKEILSDSINNINKAIGILINNEINIEDENSIKNLIISEDKKSINNILIYLIKYSFKFETAEEIKKIYQKFS